MLARKDDIPDDVRKQLEAALHVQHPGMEIVYAGDGPLDDAPEQVIDFVNKMRKQSMRSLATGCCFECGKAYPTTWPPANEEEDLAEGWAVMTVLGNDDEIIGLLCSDC